MAHPLDSASPLCETPADHPAHHSGVGFTQWLAVGLVAFTVLMVILAVVMNLILGSPGN